MIVKNAQEADANPMNKPGFSGMAARYMLSADDGCPHYALRLMEWAPGGYTSYHRHKEEHEMFVLEGEAVAVDGDKKERRLLVGDALYISPCEGHQIKNIGKGMLKMICTVPIFPGMDGKSTSPCDE